MAAQKRGLILVDHGSRHAAAHEHLEAIGRQVQSRVPGWSVSVAHMEIASPSLDDALAASVKHGVKGVWVLPMFLVPGRHLTRDIPAIVRAAASEFPEVSVRVLPGLGMSRGLPDLLLSMLEAGTTAAPRPAALA